MILVDLQSEKFGAPHASYEDVVVMPMWWPGLVLAAATWTLRSA